MKSADSDLHLDALEVKVRQIQKERLLWGEEMGLFVLQIGAVVTDDVFGDASTEIQRFQII
jgi:hypothetical protein